MSVVGGSVVIWPFSKLSRRPYFVSRWWGWDRACWADDDAAEAVEVRNLGTDSMMDVRRSHRS